MLVRLLGIILRPWARRLILLVDVHVAVTLISEGRHLIFIRLAVFNWLLGCMRRLDVRLRHLRCLIAWHFLRSFRVNFARQRWPLATCHFSCPGNFFRPCHVSIFSSLQYRVIWVLGLDARLNSRATLLTVGSLAFSMPLCVASQASLGESKFFEVCFGDPEVTDVSHELFIWHDQVLSWLCSEVQAFGVPLRLYDRLLVVLRVWLLWRRFDLLDCFGAPPFGARAGSNGSYAYHWPTILVSNQMLVRATAESNPCALDPIRSEGQFPLGCRHFVPVR